MVGRWDYSCADETEPEYGICGASNHSDTAVWLFMHGHIVIFLVSGSLRNELHCGSWQFSQQIYKVCPELCPACVYMLPVCGLINVQHLLEELADVRCKVRK